ncbi:dehydrogenase with different specificitie [Lineolata rhizophorae]|uniref:Dehydrogenase with different specificitie n=1 Tax=Lineolata rhizophorae TaxID=578093 RepID=A0A6A6PB71_9PEZI|nr:dehydrogenase with different specificitie [Lineolata rhizophorae]
MGEAYKLDEMPDGGAGTLEDMPKIQQVAGESAGPSNSTATTPHESRNRIPNRVTTLTDFRIPPRSRAKDKVVIITGANSLLGIGRAAAHQFSRNGARAVFVCDFASTHLDAHACEIRSLYAGVDVHARRFDAADEDAVRSVVDEAVEMYGRLDVFFANAGVATGRVFGDVSAEDFMKTLRVNALSVFLAVKYASKAMQRTSASKLQPGGSIIGTASVAGLRSNAGSTDYSASKAAVVSIAQTCAFQLGGTGVRVNAICPGLIESGMTKQTFDYARSRGTTGKLGQLNPTRRPGVADEVARVALFLGSDEASYVNGQAWAVCGGLSAGHPFVPGKLA